MAQEEITTEDMERLGFELAKSHPASSGSWGTFINEAAGRRLMLWEFGPCYFDVSRDGVNYQMVKQLRWPYGAEDVARAMRELGWLQA